MPGLHLRDTYPPWASEHLLKGLAASLCRENEGVEKDPGETESGDIVAASLQDRCKKQDLRLVTHCCFVALYLTPLLPSPPAERGWG